MGYGMARDADRGRGEGPTSASKVYARRMEAISIVPNDSRKMQLEWTRKTCLAVRLERELPRFEVEGNKALRVGGKVRREK